MIFKHGKDFLAEDKESLRGIDMREGMEVAKGVKDIDLRSCNSRQAMLQSSDNPENSDWAI